MANRLPIPPPGFDELPVDDQIDYVQSLWDRIAASVNQVPLHEWQRQLLEERLAEHRTNPDDTESWDESLVELKNERRAR